MKKFSDFIKENKGNSRESLLIYIANNLYRLGNRKQKNPNSILLMLAAATLLNSGDSPQANSAARRLAQLAISKQQGS